MNDNILFYGGITIFILIGIFAYKLVEYCNKNGLFGKKYKLISKLEDDGVKE